MAQRPSTLQFEQAFLATWPARETKYDGGWLWRFADGYTKRANSAQSLDPEDGYDVMLRLEKFGAWARARDLSPVFKVTPLANERIISALNAAHWQSFDQSAVMAMPLGAVFTPKHACLVLQPGDPIWYEAQAQLSQYDGETLNALNAILGRISAPVAGFVVLDEAGVPAASALASNSGGISVYLNVVVRDDLRGTGYGRSIMQAALNWSRKRKASWAAVQVVSDNISAINLYRSLGFRDIYRYHYRRPQIQ